MTLSTTSISTDKVQSKTPNLLEKLRSETRDEHNAIESSMSIFRADFSLNAYEQTLEKFLGFYEPFEERLKVFIELLPEDLDLDQRFKTQHLKNDLAPFYTTDQRPKCKELPEIKNVYDAIGALYVLEGSTLGGQIITQQVQKTLNLPLDRIQFFSAYQDKTGDMWSKFKSVVIDFVEPQHHGEVIVAAQATFRSLRRWLEKSS